MKTTSPRTPPASLVNELTAIGAAGPRTLNRPWVVWLVAFLALCTRRLDQILIPQFYAEDGTEFFAGAVRGWAWFEPVGSYLNLGPRVVASLLAWVPWEWMPLAYALAAAAVTAWVCVRVWGSTLPVAVRWVGAVAVVAVPTAGEPFLNLCCLHFILAVPLVVALLEGRGRWWEVALCALSGPEVLVLLPLSIWSAWRFRNWKMVGTLWACAAIQVVYILTAQRASMAGVVPPFLLVRLYARVAFLNWAQITAAQGWALSTGVAGIVLAAAWRNKYWAPSVIVFGVGILYLMAGRSVTTGWANPYGNGARYAYLPFWCFLVGLGYLATQGWRRWAMGGLVGLVLAGAVVRWAGDIPRNQKWRQQVAQYRAGARETFTIPWGGGITVEMKAPR